MNSDAPLKEVAILCGPARSGKTTRALAAYHETISRHGPGTALWLAPTYRGTVHVRRRILTEELSAVLGPKVMTFDQLAASVSASSGPPLRFIDRQLGRRLVRRLIRTAAESGELKHFESIAGRDGFITQVCGWIAELKRLEIWPKHLHAACHARGATPKDEALLHLYREYQRALRERGLYDAEGVAWTARELLRQGRAGEFASVSKKKWIAGIVMRPRAARRRL